MISTEYPPMQGGVGRYCQKLVNSLTEEGMDVFVVCDKFGNGQYNGIFPKNKENSQVLLKIANEIEPDLVHVQYEHGLYGLHLDPINPRNTHNTIEYFYRKCKIPIHFK
jgi:hypothetical protein